MILPDVGDCPFFRTSAECLRFIGRNCPVFRFDLLCA